MACSRRDFVKGGVAAATVPWLGGCLTGPSAAVTRFGVLSDTHVTGSESLAGLTSVFRFFKSRQVDAVLHCGDLVTRNRIPVERDMTSLRRRH